MMLKDRVAEAIRAVFPDANTEGLKEVYGRVDGFIVSSSLYDLPMDQRYRRMWDRIQQDLGPEVKNVGLILPYAPGEGA